MLETEVIAWLEREILKAIDDGFFTFIYGMARDIDIWTAGKRLDVFFVMLNKSNKDYSPPTMYNDYFINEWLFH